MQPPFLEHPGEDEFPSARAAIAAAIERIRERGLTDRSFYVGASGQGGREDSHALAAVALEDETFFLSDPTEAMGTTVQELEFEWIFEGDVAAIPIDDRSPPDVAELLDRLFREHLGIRPYADYDDYGFGVEFEEEE